MPETPNQPDRVDTARYAMMQVLANADVKALDEHFTDLGELPAWRYIRKPEVGLVMLRGQIGGSGAPFNFGEATMTRAAIVLESGEQGFGQCLGRARRKAAISAIIDGLYQRSEWRERIDADLVGPLRTAQEGNDALRRAETAATKVDFFTLARGEDG
ncbi:MAG: phosphonate C-P lyase system protein PhnG [Pseudomonadota bacterium]